jgi:hypothetical protein
MGEECQEEANSRFFINAFKSYLGNSVTFKNLPRTFFPRFVLVEFYYLGHSKQEQNSILLTSVVLIAVLKDKNQCRYQILVIVLKRWTAFF